MKGHLAELEAFNAENYVKETIEASKKVWEKELAPTGRKLYPHWSRLMTLEVNKLKGFTNLFHSFLPFQSQKYASNESSFSMMCFERAT